MSGGVRDDASLDAALEAGAARVNIGTAALENPDWTASVIKKYGDRVAVGLDVRGHTLAAPRLGEGRWRPVRDHEVPRLVGCSRYVVTDVARDGMMSGPNIELLREVASRTDAKVTASGGISKLDDLRNIKGARRTGRGRRDSRQIAVRARLHAGGSPRSRTLTCRDTACVNDVRNMRMERLDTMDKQQRVCFAHGRGTRRALHCLWFTDVLGTLKSVAIAPAELEAAFEEGLGFDGSAVEGLTVCPKTT